MAYEIILKNSESGDQNETEGACYTQVFSGTGGAAENAF
jgi:hypothetical protein